LFYFLPLDVLSNRKLLSMLLKRHQIECSMAGNGVEALQIVRDSFQFYDIIFMDNFMPVMVCCHYVCNK